MATKSERRNREKVERKLALAQIAEQGGAQTPEQTAETTPQPAEKKAKKQPITPPGMPALPPMPKSAKKAKPTRPCACGCGTPTKGTWAPGHDGYVHGWAIRVLRGVVKLSDVPEACRPAVKADVAKREAKAQKTA